MIQTTEKSNIRYEIATALAKKMLKAGLISEEEFERIDSLNKKKFLVSEV